MAKDIEVLGRPIKIAFNMAVQIAYEDITGQLFDLTQLNTKKASLALNMAAIITNNPMTDITMEMLMTEATFDDLHAIDVALSGEMADWYKIPATMPESEGKGKNKPIKRPRTV